MKAISTLTLIIALIALFTGGYNQFIQISELRKEQTQMAEDVLKLKQEIAKFWHHSRVLNNLSTLVGINYSQNKRTKPL